MSGNIFHFKQFTIHQDKCAMKVGTDAVLLGAWTNPQKAERILDIGTGTGILSLMLAQKCDAIIDAIDIDENACMQAKENFGNSKWSERLNIKQVSVQDFALLSSKKYDLIISNPPFFIDSSKAPDPERTISRHTDLLPYEELIAGVLKLLLPEGQFCLILPAKEGELFQELAANNDLHLTKLLNVKGSSDKLNPKRLLMQFEFTERNLEKSSIAVEADKRHHYTDDYKELTKNYYLNF